MKKIIFSSIFVLILGFASQASAIIMLTPTTAGVIAGPGLDPAGCEAGCVYDAFGLVDDGSLSLLYKSAVGDPDEGTFADDYTTTFSSTSTDPEDALIEHVATGGDDFISCPDCYLAIKDGKHDPAYYFYDLSAWDGAMDIEMTGFWPGGGAISHVSIWGRDSLIPPPSGIPEPTSLLLLAIGLIGLTLQGRRAR